MKYELEEKQNKKRNEKYIKEFEEWLNEKKLADKTIKKHLSNVDLYINEYLNYYDVTKMEDGIKAVFSFLNGWFIEKCMWASKNSIKETATSIRKFYQCMSEKNYVSEDEYKNLCSDLKENLDECLDTLKKFDNGTYYDMFW